MVNKTKPKDLKTIGQWTWNSKLLNEKVIPGPDNECWSSKNFAQTKHGPLFGVMKNSRRQMSQVCRILYRDWFNDDCEDKEITHACGNKYCLNKNHWLVKPYKKHGRPPNTNTKPVKTARAKRWWDA
jgi:hypothetical protein